MFGNVLAIVLSYLIGAIPLGLFLVYAIKGVDIREYGSGKIGASNVLRLVGVPAAVLVFAFDAAKGIIAILLVKAMGDAVWAEAAAAFAALAGHNWSVFIRFTGGRGVSTGLGALFIMAPVWGAAALGFGLIIVLVFRYVSLGSLLGTAAAMVMVLVSALQGQEPWAYFAYAAVAGSLIWVQHHDNIARLLKGTERRIGDPPEHRVAEGNEA